MKYASPCKFTMTKGKLRAIYKTQRDSIPKSSKRNFDKCITEKIISLPEFKAAENVLLFASVGSEFDTNGIFLECIRQNKKVYFPKCLPENKMEFYFVAKKEDLAVGKYNIPEPKANGKYTYKKKSDFAVIPALAVGRDFTRLGYGGGYYDRFLKDFYGVTVCPVYPYAVSDGLPSDEYDIPPQIIVTPSEILKRQ